MGGRSPTRLVATLLAAAIAAGCYQRSERLPEVDDDDGAPDERPVLALCVVPSRLPRETVLRFDPLARRLSTDTPWRVVVRPAATWAAALARLAREEADLGVIGPAAFVRAERRGDVVGIARMRESGRENYRGAVVVRDDDEAREIVDLRGRRLGLVGPESTTGHLLPLAGLMRAGVARDALAGIRYYGRQDLVARAVQLGEVDAGAVRETTAHRYRPQGLRVLWLSEPVPGPVLVARPGFSSEDLDRLRRLVLEAGDESEPEFSELTEGSSEPVRSLLTEVHGGRAFTADLSLEGAEPR